jgi:hypothetical protein
VLNDLPIVRLREKPNSLALQNNTLAFWYSLVLFFPYPALAVGRSTGIQAGHVFTVVIWGIFGQKILSSKRLIACFLFLVIPYLPSLLFGSQDSLNINSAVTQAFALAVFPAVAILVRSRAAFNSFMLGASIAVLIHGGVGVWQQISYQNQIFPFISIYQNPSFAEMEPGKIQNLYAVYSKRSFGIFPEPSAMMASLAPFMVLLIYKYFKFEPRNSWNKKFNAVCIFFGLALFYFSRSGAIPYFVLALAPLAYMQMRKALKMPPLNALLYYFVVFSVLAGLSLSFLEIFQERAASELGQEGSWKERFASLIFGLSAIFNGTLLELIFGYGLGDVAVLTNAATGSSSVHSWIIATIMGTGITGLVGMLCVLRSIFQGIRRSSEKWAGYCVLFIWLTAIGLVTGYIQLLPTWACLGILLNWKTIFRKNEQ